MCLIKTRASFEIRTYIKGRVNVIILGLQTYYELCQIYKTSAVSKTLVFRSQQDDFTKLVDVPIPGQPLTVATNANSAAVAGLIKRDARL